MRDKRTGMTFLKRGRPGWGTAIVSIWAGFMIATAGIAVFPSFTSLVTPLVCANGGEVESSHFSYGPGTSGVSRQYNCLDASGKPESAMFKTIFATFVAYTLIFYVLLALLGLWRGRKGNAAPAPAIPGPRSGQPHYPADPLADFITRPRAAPPAPSGEADTVRRLTELKRLHDQGLIDDQDYEAKKAEILSGL